MTRSNGEFRFADLSAGAYKLITQEQLDRDQPPVAAPSIQLYGYPPVSFPSATSLSAAETISVSAGQIFQADLALTRQPYFSVKVSVGSSTPITNLGVIVSLAGSHGPGYRLGYNAQTQNIEGLLPQGVYSVEAVSFSQPPTVGETLLTVRNAPVSVGRITLVAAQTISVNVKEEFASARTSAPFERLLESGGVHGPRLYLSIRLEPADDFSQRGGASLRPPTGPKDESLILEYVAPGRYWAHVDTSSGYASSVTSGGVDLQFEPLVVGNGAPPPIEITMRDASARLDGTVEGIDTSTDTATSSGTSLPSVHVYCLPLPDSHGRYAEAVSGSDGNFSFSELPPGAYRVIAFRSAQANLDYRDPEVMHAFDATGAAVHLTGGQNEHITLPLSQPPSQPPSQPLDQKGEQ